MSLRDQIIASSDLSYEDVEVPEWAVTVRVVSPTVRERSRIVAAFMDDHGKVDLERMYPTLVIATAVDPETGDRLFSDEDHEALCGKNGLAVERVAQAALRVAGLGENAVEVGKGG